MEERLTRPGRRWSHPLFVVGVVLVAIVVGIAIYAVIAIPHSEAVRLWRTDLGVWEENARRAAPVWFDWFTRDSLPPTTVIRLDEATTTREAIGDGVDRVEVVLPFSYNYDRFPSELSLLIEASLDGEYAHISLYWLRPDGKTITMQEDRHIRESHSYRISQDRELHSELGVAPHVGLFAKEGGIPSDDMELLWGDYRLVMEAELAEGEEFLETDLVVYGQVEGWAGTDHQRRDLGVALLFGALAALAFGTMGPAAIITGLVAIVLGVTKARRRHDTRSPRSMRAVLLPLFFLLFAAFVLVTAARDAAGLGDPLLPTWGKLVYDARTNDALSMGLHYWVVQPVVLIVMTGLGLALVGWSFRRIFKPKAETAE